LIYNQENSIVSFFRKKRKIWKSSLLEKHSNLVNPVANQAFKTPTLDNSNFLLAIKKL
jgi:hypothetical protein